VNSGVEEPGHEPPRARLIGIRRRFGSVVALDGADFTVLRGEVHALLGENGAGKSTLLGILAGTLRPDAGILEIGGTPVTLRSPRDAWARGVGLVHQHFTLVPALTALENLALGRRGRGGWSVPLDRVAEEAREIVRRTRLEVDLDARIEDLGVGARQRVEILKALLRDPALLALDEPTAVLTPPEVEALWELLRSLAARGHAVVLVGHKIDEVLRVADRVTVLRGGKTTLSASRADIDARSLIRAMVGRDVDDRAAVGWMRDGGAVPAAPAARDIVAVLDDVRVVDGRGRLRLDGVSLAVHRGEVVAVAGVEGNGQRELALVLAGRLRPVTGTVTLPLRLGFVPEDRTREGVIADFDLAENVALSLHRDADFVYGPTLRWDAIRVRAEEVRERYGIRAPSTRTRARALSGGNQQRLVLGRELAGDPDLVVAENPARGLDVAATSFVHGELVRLAREDGRCGVVLVSSDLDEALTLADRILVMSRGRLVAVGDADRTREGVGALMLGAEHASI
jgi:simple sugar transport system ATP-binding protein